MADKRKPVSFAHDPELGEVDPRHYPLVCKVHLADTQIGSHTRVLQAQRICRVLDKMFEELGENQARIHFTNEPGVDAKQHIEVRAQCITIETAEEEAKVVAQVVAQVESLKEHGETGGWTVVE